MSAWKQGIEFDFFFYIDNASCTWAPLLLSHPLQHCDELTTTKFSFFDVKERKLVIPLPVIPVTPHSINLKNCSWTVFPENWKYLLIYFTSHCWKMSVPTADSWSVEQLYFGSVLVAWNESFKHVPISCILHFLFPLVPINLDVCKSAWLQVFYYTTIYAHADGHNCPTLILKLRY